MPEHHGGAAGAQTLLLGAILAVLLCGYLAAVRTARRRGRRWPWWRTAAWGAGLSSAAAGLVGPLSTAAHHDFVAHAATHLLVGMLAPLLLVVAAPVTVLLRALPVGGARRLSRLLNSRPVRIVTHPVPATVLNAGGLWLLYAAGGYQAMGAHGAVHVAVHLHLLLAGYVFTAALIGVDPAPHRSRFATRAVVLVAFVAAHGILSKYLYANPPGGVPADQAAAGAMLMYYGGDLVDLILMVELCRRWYAASAPGRVVRPPRTAAPAGWAPAAGAAAADRARTSAAGRPRDDSARSTEQPITTHTFG